MGAEQSTPTAFTVIYEALPDDAHDQVEALCAKDDDRLLKPHARAPPPYPPVPIGVTVRLSSSMASAALAAVPRLQRKHYEMIPKSLSEIDFWISFFSHLTAIVMDAVPEKLVEVEGAAEWKGVDGSEGPNSFDAVWTGLSDSKRAAVEALVTPENDALLKPSMASPPAFPQLPLGMECFIDETAATSALTIVKGLQRKHYALVPKKLDERAFWTNFFTHMTAAVA